MSNVDTEIEAPAEVQVPLNEAPTDGPGSGRGAIRKELEKNTEAARKAAEPRQERRGKVTKSRVRQEEEAVEAEAAAEGEPALEEEVLEEALEGPKPPEGWTKEAKAEWEILSPAVQAAVSKRETDMSKGVEDLKKKYSEIDQALQPRMDTIRRHGHTPGQAVNQLFAWFDALSANPGVAFPALAHSFKFDLRQIPGLLPQQQAAQQAAQQANQQQAPAAGEQPEISPAVQRLIDMQRQQIEELRQGFSNQIGQLSNNFQQASQQKTEEILATWARDKPYYEEVRRTMAQLIASQTVPPMSNGMADLDKAYDMALYALPEVRTKVLAEQEQKRITELKAKRETEKKAQQEQADKARKAAAGSLAGGAPGNPVQPQKGKMKTRSVRESIMEAREALANDR